MILSFSGVYVATDWLHGDGEEEGISVFVPPSLNVTCPMKAGYKDHVLQEDGFCQSKGEVLERCR